MSEVNLMAGDTFKRSFFGKGVFKINEGAKVTIMTSSAFEGWDLLEANCSIFVLQNTAAPFVQFLAPQIIQALGRIRGEAEHLEVFWYSDSYNIQTLSSTVLKHLDHLEDVAAKYCTLHTKKTLTGKNPEFEKQSNIREIALESENFAFRFKGDLVKLGNVRSLIVFNDLHNGLKAAGVNTLACDVIRQKIRTAATGIDASYYNSRGYTIRHEPSTPTPPPTRERVKQQTRVKNYCSNRDVNKGLISVRQLISWSFTKNSSNLKEVYDLLSDHLGTETPQRITTFFATFKGMNDLIKQCKQVNPKMKPESLKASLPEVIYSFLTKKQPAEKIRAFRDYNAFTPFSDDLINFIAAKFGIKKLSFDLSAFAPSLFQTLSGAKVYDWYSEGDLRKQSKQKINAALNSLYYETNTANKALGTLRKAGATEKTIQYLKDNFYQNGISGKLYSTFTFHEAKLMDKAKRLIEQSQRNQEEKSLMIRKHDEIIVFYSDCDITDDQLKTLEINYKIELNKLEHEGRNGWFAPPEKAIRTYPQIEQGQNFGYPKPATGMGLRATVTHNIITQRFEHTKTKSREPRNHPPEWIRDPHDEKYYADVF